MSGRVPIMKESFIENLLREAQANPETKWVVYTRTHKQYESFMKRKWPKNVSISIPTVNT